MARRITLHLQEFGWDAVVMTATRNGLHESELVTAACRGYLAEAGREGPPSFIKERERAAAGPPEREITIELTPDEFDAMKREAHRHGVTVDTLARHATFLLLADIESGRVGADVAHTAELDDAI